MHEKSDINIRIIVGFGAALAVAAVLIHVAVWLLFDLYGGLNARAYPREFPMAPQGELRLPAAPRLQERPREELKAFRHDEDATLNGYTWINRQTGAVRIPIEEAMKRVLDQGLPARADAPPDGIVRPSRANSGRGPGQ